MGCVELVCLLRCVIGRVSSEGLPLEVVGNLYCLFLPNAAISGLVNCQVQLCVNRLTWLKLLEFSLWGVRDGSYHCFTGISSVGAFIHDFMSVCNCKGFPGMNGEEKMGVCSGAWGAGGGVVWPLLWRGWCFCFEAQLVWVSVVPCCALCGSSRNFSHTQLSFPGCRLCFASQIGKDDVEQLEEENRMDS